MCVPHTTHTGGIHGMAFTAEVHRRRKNFLGPATELVSRVKATRVTGDPIVAMIETSRVPKQSVELLGLSLAIVIHPPHLSAHSNL